MIIRKAGAVVCDPEKQNVLLVYRLGKDGWSFPKGQVETGETEEQTAIREVLEETGYAMQILSFLPKLIYLTDDGKHVEVAMFLAEPSGKRDEPEGGSTTEWIPLTKVEKKLSYENLREYWRTIEHLVTR